ncbi:MAG: 2-succinyl-5-enolpyruvyl-6-hydroxy-3-cyclohexene-1-carboxylic-acid synthase [Micrococcaceae bacterium]
MNNSFLRALTVLRTIAAHGVKHAIISPGSRNAPFIYASASVSEIEFHSRIDERTAAFTALGIAKETNQPTAVITTSGTAVAHTYPAILEAEKSNIPLLIISADRPSFLKNSGASQTLDQNELFGKHVNFALDIHESYPVHALTQEVTRAISYSIGFKNNSGPVHINVAFAEPLLPRTNTEDSIKIPKLRKTKSHQVDWKANKNSPNGTLVIAAEGSTEDAKDYAEQFRLPIIADITTPAQASENTVSYPEELVKYFIPQIKQVIVFGKPTLFRTVLSLLANSELEIIIVSTDMAWHNSGMQATKIADLASLPTFATNDSKWLAKWQKASKIANATHNFSELNQFAAAKIIWKNKNCARLVVGASNIIRHLTTVSNTNLPAEKILSSRGLAGIDGTIATATGVAIASKKPTRVYLGDITALHDASSLYKAPLEADYDLHIVILNDGGGTIFNTLEHGAQTQYQNTVHRFFTTPQDANFKALAAAYDWRYNQANTISELNECIDDYKKGRVITEVIIEAVDIRTLQNEISQQVIEKLIKTIGKLDY